MSTQPYSHRVREAHERAIELRRSARKRVTERYQSQIELDIEAEYRTINRQVADVIEGELRQGVPRGDIRRALKSSSSYVWRQYMDLLDDDRKGQPGRIPGTVKKETAPVQDDVVWTSPKGAVWNFTKRTVTNDDRTWPITRFGWAPGKESPYFMTPATIVLGFDEAPDAEARIEIASRVDKYWGPEYDETGTLIEEDA